MSGEVDLKRWGPHLRAAQRASKTLAQYARECGLSRHTLYAAHQMLRKAEDADTPARGRIRRSVQRKLSAVFAPVRVVAPAVGSAAILPEPAGAPRLLVRLPNGVVLELDCAGADAALLGALIALLASVPCSG
jgi:hypothetical protein